MQFMQGIRIFFAILLIVPALTACMHLRPKGYVYTHITTPLDINADKTPIGPAESKKGDIKHIHYRVDIKWDSNAIGDIAKQSGLNEVYFADIETLSILSLWSQYTVHVYGK
ncbi:MAG: hypothetical protein KKC46_00950 [Proteobacteria bacterium]|nr:hypothetical protein [Pseudomonadota bacterium]